MNLLQEPPEGFENVTKAFAMARQIPASQRLAMKIGLARDGALFAVGELDGHRQISFFKEHMRDLGYREHLLGGGDEMFGCDMLFSPRPADEPADSDPSFIRRPAVQLWPVRG